MGQRADITQAKELVVGYEPAALLADRGYDADKLIDWLDEHQIEVVIPAKLNRLEQRVIDKNLYRDRNKRGRPSGGAVFQQAQSVSSGSNSL